MSAGTAAEESQYAELRSEGNELMVEEEYAEALEKYSEAIKKGGDKAKCYLPRAACHLKLNNYKEALSDATNAVRLNPKNATAYYRLGLSNFHLENFHASQTALTKAKELGNKRCDLWLRKCQAEIEDGDKDVVMHQAEPISTSNIVEEKKSHAPPSDPMVITSTSSSSSSSSNGKTAAPVPMIVKKPSMKFIDRGSKVECAVYSKNATVVDVSYTDSSFSVKLQLANGEDWEASLETYGEIKPKQCSFTQSQYKVTLSLKKADESMVWKSLEKVEDSDPNVQRRENETARPGEVPSYPSSNPKQINWDIVNKEVAEEAEKEKLEGDQALNKLFSDLYAKGDENTRRAMVKSMQTSGGTCLSMNWDEVKNTDYASEIQAPSGSEVHRYEH